MPVFRRTKNTHHKTTVKFQQQQQQQQQQLSSSTPCPKSIFLAPLAHNCRRLNCAQLLATPKTTHPQINLVSAGTIQLQASSFVHTYSRRLCCRQKYNEFVVCVKENHGDNDACVGARRLALNICPTGWVSTWDEQRTTGKFLGVQEVDADPKDHHSHH